MARYYLDKKIIDYAVIFVSRLRNRSVTGLIVLGIRGVRLTLNGENLGLFRLGKTIYTENLLLKKSQTCQIWAQSGLNWGQLCLPCDVVTEAGCRDGKFWHSDAS